MSMEVRVIQINAILYNNHLILWKTYTFLNRRFFLILVPGPPKKLPNWAQDGHLGAIMAHLGRNLLPTWPISRPSWDHLRQKSAPNRARNLKKRPQRLQDHPGGRQRAPGQPWFRDRFRISFFILFCSLSFNSSWPPCLKFKARGGFARAAHCIVF